MEMKKKSMWPLEVIDALAKMLNRYKRQEPWRDMITGKKQWVVVKEENVFEDPNDPAIMKRIIKTKTK